MGRESRRRLTPNLPKVEKVELSDRHLKGRIAAAAVFLIIGAAAIAYGVAQLTRTEAGWQSVTASGDSLEYASEFVLSYELGASGASAGEEERAIRRIYNDAVLTAGRALDPDAESQGNLHALNASPNETVELDPVLYSALELLERCGDRTAYLGPAFDLYGSVLTCTDDWQLPDVDPEQNDDLRALYGKIAAYAGDPQSVNVELLGGNTARLNVSEEYLRFLDDEELAGPLDLAWMKNAFIADYVADALSGAGYTHGSITSFDGYTRNLDAGAYSLNIFDRAGTGVVTAARLDYQSPMALVSFRTFPITDMDVYRIYMTEDGQSKHLYLSQEDGLPRTGSPSLTAWSDTLGCAETMLLASKVFLREEISESDLSALSDIGVRTVTVTDRKLLVSDSGIKLENVYDGYTVKPV